VRTGWGLILGLTVWLVAGAEAAADKRVALVIGNSGYRNVASLTNPVNDAAAVADLLSHTGFDVVESYRDLGADEFRRALRTFSRQVLNADIAIVFYAGHGMEANGSNYLIPVDAKLESDIDIEDETISLDRVLAAVEPARRLRLVILDACRDNPFASTMKRTVAARTVGRGLARVEPVTSNTLVAFAAKAGFVASDGNGPHSPFTSALIKHLAEPGLDLRIAFGRIRDEVLERTGQQQEPFVYGSLGGTTLSLVPLQTAKPSESTAPPQAAGSANADARADYQLTKEIGTLEAWDYFLKQHADGFYADLARAQRAKLIAEQAASKPDVNSGQGPKRQADTPFEAATPSEDAASTIAPEQQTKSSGAETVAKVAPSEPPLAPVSAPAPLSDTSDIARQLQAHLRRVGCGPGTADGRWNEESKKALERFNKNAGTRFSVHVATLDALEAVQSRTSRVCPLVCEQGMKAAGDQCVRKAKAPTKPTASPEPHHRAAAKAGGKCLYFNGSHFCE
jgi:uncharacterized caspase-like protein